MAKAEWSALTRAERRASRRRSAKDELAQAFNRDEAIGRRAARRSKSVGATLKIGAAAAVGGILYGLLKRRK